MAGDQTAVKRFLSEGSTYGEPGGDVTRISTHGAHVFLVGNDAYKMKRAVHYPGMDLSTLELRHKACLRELEINKAAAPEIYLGVVPVTRGEDGALALGGGGEPVEWLVHMKRFDQSDLLDAVARSGDLTRELAETLACEIANYHKTAPKVLKGAERLTTPQVVEQTVSAFRHAEDIFPASETERYAVAATALADKFGPTFKERLRHGHVRRCHGDLHLQNVVLVDGRPRLFDAIEFNEAFARIDVYYDLAFILMDLDHADMRAIANVLFNRYLTETHHDALGSALSLLPLFLACRAAVRAMVSGWRAGHHGDAGDDALREEAVAGARAYLREAINYLEPAPPRLVAVGGVSGTGKTTLSRALAPDIGASPGAVHLRTDVERKAMFNVVRTHRLGADAYRDNVSELVYGRLLKKAESALRGGQSVILDGVFMKASDRAYAERLARRLEVPFKGLWLTAPEAVMVDRVSKRRGDASDADADVVALQLGRGSGPVSWSALSTQGDLDDTVAAAKEELAEDGA